MLLRNRYLHWDSVFNRGPRKILYHIASLISPRDIKQFSVVELATVLTRYRGYIRILISCPPWVNAEDEDTLVYWFQHVVSAEFRLEVLSAWAALMQH